MDDNYGEFINDAVKYTDEEFLEYVSNFIPYNFDDKKTPSIDYWTLKPFGELSIISLCRILLNVLNHFQILILASDEKKEHWLEFKNGFKDETTARVVYAELLSRPKRTNALMDLQVELRHKPKSKIAPLIEPCTDEARMDHEWKQFNEGFNYNKFFQSQMREDDVSNRMLINFIIFNQYFFSGYK